MSVGPPPAPFAFSAGLSIAGKPVFTKSGTVDPKILPNPKTEDTVRVVRAYAALPPEASWAAAHQTYTTASAILTHLSSTLPSPPSSDIDGLGKERSFEVHAFATGCVASKDFFAKFGAEVYPHGGKYGLLSITGFASPAAAAALIAAAAAAPDGLLTYKGVGPEGPLVYKIFIDAAVTRWEVSLQPPEFALTGTPYHTITTDEVHAAAVLLGLNIASIKPRVQEMAHPLPPPADGGPAPPTSVPLAGFEVVTLGHGLLPAGGTRSPAIGPTPRGLNWARGILTKAEPTGKDGKVVAPADASATTVTTINLTAASVLFMRLTPLGGSADPQGTPRILETLLPFPEADAKAKEDAAARTAVAEESRLKEEEAARKVLAAKQLETQEAELARARTALESKKAAAAASGVDGSDSNGDQAMPLAQDTDSEPTIITIQDVAKSDLLAGASLNEPIMPGDDGTKQVFEVLVYDKVEMGTHVASNELATLLEAKAEWGQAIVEKAAAEAKAATFTARDRNAPTLTADEKERLTMLIEHTSILSAKCLCLKTTIALLVAEALGHTKVEEAAKIAIATAAVARVNGKKAFKPLDRATRAKMAARSTGDWIGLCDAGLEAIIAAARDIRAGLEKEAATLAARNHAAAMAKAQKEEEAAAKRAAAEAAKPPEPAAKPNATVGAEGKGKAAATAAPAPPGPTPTPPPSEEARLKALSKAASKAARTAQEAANAEAAAKAAEAEAAASLQQLAAGLEAEAKGELISHAAAAKWLVKVLAARGIAFPKGSPGRKDPLAVTPTSTSGTLHAALLTLASLHLDPHLTELVRARIQASEAASSLAEAAATLKEGEASLTKARALAAEAARLQEAIVPSDPATAAAAEEANAKAAALTEAKVKHDLHQAEADKVEAELALAESRRTLPYTYAVSADPANLNRSPTATRAVVDAASNLVAEVQADEASLITEPGAAPALAKARTDHFNATLATLFDTPPQTMVGLLADPLALRARIVTLVKELQAKALGPVHPREEAEDEDEKPPPAKSGRTGESISMEEGTTAGSAGPAAAASAGDIGQQLQQTTGASAGLPGGQAAPTAAL